MIRTSRKTTIVIVDDEPIIVRVAEKILCKAFGHLLEIYATTDSKDALEYISQRRCDILLTDIEMPGVHGLDMLRAARKCSPWTRVILLTAHSTWELIAEAIENGATDYLIKPFDHEELVRIIGQERERLERWNMALRGAVKIASE